MAMVPADLPAVPRESVSPPEKIRVPARLYRNAWPEVRAPYFSKTTVSERNWRSTSASSKLRFATSEVWEFGPVKTREILSFERNSSGRFTRFSRVARLHGHCECRTTTNWSRSCGRLVRGALAEPPPALNSHDMAAHIEAAMAIAQIDNPTV